ncbi:hypothetical protein ACHQM5_007241 [Ranunculus cassubicifolius]
MAALRRALIGARQTLNSIRSNSLSAAIQSQSPYKFNQNLGPISNFSYKSQSFNVGDLSNEENKRQIVNRLLYRSKQRGYLELDLVLGNWVEEHISSMDEPKIKALVDVLDLKFNDGCSKLVVEVEVGGSCIGGWWRQMEKTQSQPLK